MPAKVGYLVIDAADPAALEAAIHTEPTLTLVLTSSPHRRYG